MAGRDTVNHYFFGVALFCWTSAKNI